jgi:tetratricopeptide (TPR) repeat protein
MFADRFVAIYFRRHISQQQEIELCDQSALLYTMKFNTYINPSMETATKQFEAVDLNNQGQMLNRQHRYQEALPLFQKALRLKIEAFGSHSIQAALSYNSLGECYLKLGNHQLARENFEKALAYRQTEGECMDTRVTRDNLGRVCEELGDRQGARMHRREGANLCGNDECSANPPGAQTRLPACAKCKAIFYCCASCQRVDWPRHKKYCTILQSSNP